MRHINYMSYVNCMSYVSSMSYMSYVSYNSFLYESLKNRMRLLEFFLNLIFLVFKILQNILVNM